MMPEDADPQALATLAQQNSAVLPQQADPRIPTNIQPYQPLLAQKNAAATAPGPIQLPGGPVIAPYEPAPVGPAVRPPPFVPGPASNLPQGRWGPGGYTATSPPTAASSGSMAGATSFGVKGSVERIAKGDLLVGPDVAKRLVSQCTATKTSAAQLGEIVCERVRRLYLGLDGGDPADADASLARLLAFTDVLMQQDSDISNGAVADIRQGVMEEFSSLRSSAKHKDEAEPMLKRLVEGAAPSVPETVDLLSGGAVASSAPVPKADTPDLLGAEEQTVIPTSAEPDLLGDLAVESDTVASLDPA